MPPPLTVPYAQRTPSLAKGLPFNPPTMAFKQSLTGIQTGSQCCQWPMGLPFKQSLTGIQPGGSAQGSLGLMQEGIGRARPVQGFRATMPGALIRDPWRLRNDGTHESRRSLAALEKKSRCSSLRKWNGTEKISMASAQGKLKPNGCRLQQAVDPLSAGAGSAKGAGFSPERF